MLLVEGDEDCRSAGHFSRTPLSAPPKQTAFSPSPRSAPPARIMPRYPAADGHVKLAAAWLVEQSGFTKGYSLGPVGISRKQTLAIVNRGGATAKDILALKDLIQKKVFDVWGADCSRSRYLWVLTGSTRVHCGLARSTVPQTGELVSLQPRIILFGDAAPSDRYTAKPPNQRPPS